MIPVSFDITLFIVAMLGAVVAVGIALLRQLLLFSERKRLAAAEAKTAQLKKKQELLTENYRRLQERVRSADVDIKAMHTQILEVQRRIKAAKADNYTIIHEMGEPSRGRRLYSCSLGLSAALTINGVSAKDSPLRMVRHHVDVWASDEAEALDMVRRSFPVEAGFTPSKLTQAGAAAAAPPPPPVRTAFPTRPPRAAAAE